jgi:transposase
MAKKPKKRRITGGVDTHKDTHHAAVVLMNGRRLADAEFPTTAAGHAKLLEWMRSFGRLHTVGWKAQAPTAPAWLATWPANR